jgi:DivIVA domain-containing protein
MSRVKGRWCSKTAACAELGPEVIAMSVTPVDVHNVVFTETPQGTRGYDVDEVDAFLDVVGSELARLIEENSELRAGGHGRTPAGEQPREERSVRASRILALATEAADRYVNEAKAQAEQMIGSAESNSERLVADARAKSEHVVAEAQHRAGSMMSDARTRAAEAEREARAHAAALQDAERRHVEAISLLEEKRSGIEGKIEELGTFEREYRTRVRYFLESQLRDLESREPASVTSLGMV